MFAAYIAITIIAFTDTFDKNEWFIGVLYVLNAALPIFYYLKLKKELTVTVRNMDLNKSEIQHMHKSIERKWIFKTALDRDVKNILLKHWYEERSKT